MFVFQSWSPFLIGGAIGIGGAALGAVADLWYSRRKDVQAPPLGGFLLIVAGIVNTLAGITAMILSFIFTGSIRLAIVLGLGVLAGFILGFLILAVLWILR